MLAPNIELIVTAMAFLKLDKDFPGFPDKQKENSAPRELTGGKCQDQRLTAGR